ncbi:MAG TPA: TonB-dependent receptor [Gemmatimonadales bacterium]|nr:TonB-dependent receptor [Gemmatimonadales bacterium]
MFAVAGQAEAQGVTGAAIQGRVTIADGTPLEQAAVLATNGSNGERWRTSTTSGGRYYLPYLSVGGPYRIEVRAVGYQPSERVAVFLSLGQRLSADFALVPATVTLEEITVVAAADPRINPGRTGPAQIVSEPTIVRLPVTDRDFTQLALLSPQVTLSPNGGLSFAGQHDRLNELQTDGATNRDLFSLAGSGIGTPGQFLGLTPLAPEAVKEVQIVTAPFDVRYGNFAGGLVNAVSKSGSNRFEGSVFSYFEDQGLTGRDTSGSRATAFQRQEYGLTLSGPIVRNRVAFFLNAGFRRQYLPQLAPVPTSDTIGGADSAGVGIRYASLVRFQDILRQTHGVDAGSFSRAEERIPTHSLFAKVTTQLGLNNRLEVSHSYLKAQSTHDGFRDAGFYELSSRGASRPFPVNLTRVNWTAALGRRWSNELILGRLDASDECIPTANYIGLEVQVDDGTVAAGRPPGCEGAVTAQTIWEMTDNLSLASGAHRLTFGTHGELIHLLDASLLFSGGLWFFDGLDALEQGTPSGYLRDLPGPLRPEGARADFHVRQIGLYAQDEWTPTPRLTVTAGLRFDVPFLPTPPAQNPTLLSELGIDTGITPDGNVLWSPRLGLNYDLFGRGTTFLRGGIGLFAGRPAYFWLREAYFRTGLEQVRLACFGGDVPAFTLEPTHQPTACGGTDQPIPIVVHFNPAFKFPRNLKIALGADQRLPWGLVGTVDLLYTRGVNQFEVFDSNLLPPSGSSSGEANRPLYGTLDPSSGASTPGRRSEAFQPVIEIRNGSGDRAWSLATQLQKRFAGRAELSAAYTYTNAKDRHSSPADFAYSNLGATALDGTWESRNLRTSLWSRPHKVTLNGTFDLPLKLRLGLVYVGSSGDPLTYIVRGDANADGLDNIFGGARDNDPIYVPRDAADITLADPSEFARLDQIIEEEACLRWQRGRLMERNSCRDPWVHTTQARLTKVLPTVRGQSLQLTIDLFNVLNFLDGDWGLVRHTLEDHGFFNVGSRTSLLELVGYDEANQRGIYTVLQPNRRRIDPVASRWRLQLSARYTF